MPETIFVSYAHKDRDLLDAIESILRKHGIVTGKDVVIVDPHQKFKAGSNVRKMIKEQISSASKVVIIKSDNSANSIWVNYEAGMAEALGKPIVIVGVKGSGKTDSMLRAFENVQSIEIEDKDLRSAL